MVQEFQFVPIQSVTQLSSLELDYFMKLSNMKSPDKLKVVDINGFMQGLAEFESQKRAQAKDEWSNWDDGWVL